MRKRGVIYPKVYLDVNVAGPIGNVARGNEFFQKWNNSLKKWKVFPEGISMYELVHTEGLLIELLGMRMPSIPDVAWKKLKPRSAEDYLSECLTFANQFFASHPELTKESFLKRRNEQIEYLNEEGLKLLDQLVDQPLKIPNTIKEIHNFLALEAICGRPHPKKFRKQIQLQFAFAVLGFIQQGKNTSLFRVFTQIWQEIRMTESIALIMDRDNVARMDNSLKFKTRGDFVDGELIHLAVVGYHESGITKPVSCFTCDDQVKIKDRIFQFKSVLMYVVNVIESQEKETGVKSKLSSVKLCPGTVYIVNKRSGEIIESIDVASLESVGS